MFENRLRALAVLAIATLVAGSAMAQEKEKLSKADKNWMEKEVGAIMTASEKATFEQINKDDRKLFKDLFWMRRDFNPMSPENEFQKDYMARVKAADENFKGRGQKGSESDMGQVFLLLGAPSRREQGAGKGGEQGAQPQTGASPGEEPGAGQPGGQSAFGAMGGEESSVVSWIYDPRPELGIPQGLTLQFRQASGFGYRLVTSDDLEKQLDRVKERLITNPSVNYVMDENGRLRKPDTRFDPNSPAKLALKALQETGTTSDAIAFDVKPAFFRSSAGQIYIPIDFVVTSGLTSKDATVFGSVANADGVTIYQFEEKATIEKDAQNHQAWEMPLQLQPGKYKFYVGIMDGAGAVTGTKITDLEVPDFDAAADLTLSSIIMFSQGDKVNEAMGSPGRAFLVGGYHFIPKRELVYTQKDQLAGVFNAYNFGVEGDKPNLTIQVTFFKGTERRGSTKEEPFMLQSSDMALTIFDIPLNLPNFKDPGDYHIELKVTDKVKGKTIIKEIPFVIQGE
jgi:GWxTD domain-containing protein